MVDVITIGSALQDVVIQTEGGVFVDTPEDALSLRKLAFELGAKVPVQAVTVGVGGGAANTAVAFTKLGVRTAIAARVGNDDQGRKISEELARQHIDTTLMQRDSVLQTGLSTVVIKTPESEHVAFPYRGANEALVAPSPDALDRLSPRLLYVCALQGAHWQREWDVIAEYAARRKIALVSNPGSPQLSLPIDELRGYIKRLSILLVNKDEASEIVARETPGEKNFSIKHLLAQLSGFGAEWVVITDGEQGAYATDGRSTYHAQALQVKAVDTIGAGDAFGSALAAGMILSSWNMETALAYGVINAASAVTIVGAQTGFLTRDEIEQQRKRAIIKLI